METRSKPAVCKPSLSSLMCRLGGIENLRPFLPSVLAQSPTRRKASTVRHSASRPKILAQPSLPPRVPLGKNRFLPITTRTLEATKTMCRPPDCIAPSPRPGCKSPGCARSARPLSTMRVAPEERRKSPVRFPRKDSILHLLQRKTEDTRPRVLQVSSGKLKLHHGGRKAESTLRANLRSKRRSSTQEHAERRGAVRNPVKHGAVCLADFEFLATIGVGCFGQVKLARFTATPSQPCAVKIVSKEYATRLRQAEHLVHEREMLLGLDSPFIVKWQVFAPGYNPSVATAPSRTS